MCENVHLDIGVPSFDPKRRYGEYNPVIGWAARGGTAVALLALDTLLEERQGIGGCERQPTSPRPEGAYTVRLFSGRPR
jgi:hypothetical protein